MLKAISACDLSVFIWSDSQIVLHCVSSHKPLPIFVNCRVTEMKSLLPDALMSSSLWNHVPKWLLNSARWPPSQLLPIPSLVLAAAVETEFESVLPDTGLHCVVSINCHSTLSKLLGVTTYVIHFVCHQKGPISADEYVTAKLRWLKDNQHSEYNKEFDNLNSWLNSPKTPCLMPVRQLHLLLLMPNNFYIVVVAFIMLC